MALAFLGIDFTLEEMKAIYDIDNADGDCDCSICRAYRECAKNTEQQVEPGSCTI